jgi:hypothetical protein
MLKTATLLLLILSFSAHIRGQAESLKTRVPRPKDGGNGQRVITLRLATQDLPPLRLFARDADLILRGVVSEAHSAVTDDRQSISTRYLIADPIVFFSRLPNSGRNPISQPPITFIMPGGSATIDGQRVAVLIDGVVAPSTGADLIVILKRRDDGEYVPLGTGLFEVRGTAVIPLVNWDADQIRLAGMDVDTFLNDLLNPPQEIR